MAKKYNSSYHGKRASLFPRLHEWWSLHKNKPIVKVLLKVADAIFFLALLVVVLLYSDNIKKAIDKMMGNEQTPRQYFEDRVFAQATDGIAFTGLNCSANTPALTEGTTYYVAGMSFGVNQITPLYKDTSVHTTLEEFYGEASPILDSLKSKLKTTEYFTSTDNFSDSMSYLAIQATNDSDTLPVVYQFYVYADGSQMVQTIYSVNCADFKKNKVAGFDSVSKFLRDIPAIELSSENLYAMEQIAERLAYDLGSHTVVLLNEEDTCRVTVTISGFNTDEMECVVQTSRLIAESKVS